MMVLQTEMQLAWDLNHKLEIKVKAIWFGSLLESKNFARMTPVFSWIFKSVIQKRECST